MSGTQRLLDHLKEHKEIDPLIAWTKLGIYRLGARIYDLKEAGHKIETRRKVVTNRFGETCIVALYVLEDA